MIKHRDLPPRSKGRTIILDKGKPKAAPKKVPRAVAIAKQRKLSKRMKGLQKP